MTFNPDLVFDNGLAVGHVKYKLSTGEWDRTDPYKVLAFACSRPCTGSRESGLDDG